MTVMQKVAAYGIGSTLLLGLSACNAEALQKAAKDSKEEAIELLQNDISADEYFKLLEGEKKASEHTNWSGPAAVAKINYWDSIKTDALCKKAYLEGAQMVRDSIRNANMSEIK